MDCGSKNVLERQRVGLDGLDASDGGVGERARWPATVGPWQHFACTHALAESLKANHHCLHANAQAALNPKSQTLKPRLQHDAIFQAFSQCCANVHQTMTCTAQAKTNPKPLILNPKHLASRSWSNSEVTGSLGPCSSQGWLPGLGLWVSGLGLRF